MGDDPNRKRHARTRDATLVFCHEEALDASTAYGLLTSGQQRYALAWLVAGDNTSMAEIHRKLGCTYSKVKMWSKSVPVMRACRELALAQGKQADSKLLLLHERLADELLRKFDAGEIDVLKIPTFLCRMLEGAFRRTGLDNQVVLRVDDGDTTAQISGQQGVVRQAIDDMAQRRLTENPQEHDGTPEDDDGLKVVN